MRMKISVHAHEKQMKVVSLHREMPMLLSQSCEMKGILKLLLNF